MDKQISLKRLSRYEKKMKMINHERNKKKQTSISTQTTLFNNEKILDIESFDIKIDDTTYLNKYKSKYYSSLLNLKNIQFNEENIYISNKLNKLFDSLELNLKLFNNREILFLNDDGILLKIKIEKNDIIFNLIHRHIIKKIQKTDFLNFSLKKNNSISIKINDILVLVFKSVISYYYIK